jgi:hypothetical protein
MKRLLLAAAAVLTLTTVAYANDDGDTAPERAVVAVVQNSTACWPATSNNCISLTKGEEVIVHSGRQITQNPRRGLICEFGSKGTSKNSPSLPGATKLPANDSASSRSDSLTFTPGLSAIGNESNFSRCPQLIRSP